MKNFRRALQAIVVIEQSGGWESLVSAGHRGAADAAEASVA
jgi:hypothetical protein